LNCHGEQLFSWSKHTNGTQSTTGKEQMPNQVQYNNFIQFNKVLVVGLGQLGLPVARYVKKEGLILMGMM